MQNLKISLVQTHQFWEDKSKNLAHFDAHLQEVQKGVDLIVFPEMFHTGFSMNARILAEEMDGQGVSWLQQTAKRFNAACVASLIIKVENCFFNRQVFIHPTGVVEYYDKRQLFGLAKEEETFTPGSKKKIVSFRGWNILLQVCYDLRFPEIQRNSVVNDRFEYDMLINVANWPEKRNHHWKTLIQARAIENQCYVLAVNRVGEGNGLTYSGDSALVNPLGEAIEQASHQEKVINAVVDSQFLADIRHKMPFLKDRTE